MLKYLALLFLLIPTTAFAQQQKVPYSIQMISSNLASCIANAALIGEENEKLKEQISAAQAEIKQLKDKSTSEKK